MHLIVHKIAKVPYLLPFFNTFVGFSLFVLSALLFCALLQMVSNNKFSNSSLIAFSCLYVSNPLTAYKFVYDLDIVVVMMSFCTVCLAVVYSYMFVKGNSKKYLLLAVLFLILSVGSYETFIFVYICCVFAIFIIQMLINNEDIKFKKYFTQGMKYAAILLASVVIYYVIVVIAQLANKEYGILERYSPFNDLSLKESIKLFIKLTFAIPYNMLINKIMAFRVYTIFCTIGLVGIVVYSIKKKKPLLVVSYLMMIISSVIIFYSFGGPVPRVCQAFPFVLGFLGALAFCLPFNNKFFKKAIALVLALVVFSQAVAMNKVFYDDHKTSEQAKQTMDVIATDLLKTDVTKPVVFLESEEQNEDGNNDVKTIPSFLAWSMHMFEYKLDEDEYLQRRFVIEYFKVLGYDYLITPTKEEAALANEIANDIPSFPEDGYIKEYDDFIAVKLR